MAEQKTWSFCKECRKKYTEAELKYMQDNSDLTVLLAEKERECRRLREAILEIRRTLVHNELVVVKIAKQALEGEKR